MTSQKKKTLQSLVIGSGIAIGLVWLLGIAFLVLMTVGTYYAGAAAAMVWFPLFIGFGYWIYKEIKKKNPDFGNHQAEAGKERKPFNHDKYGPY